LHENKVGKIKIKENITLRPLKGGFSKWSEKDAKQQRGWVKREPVL